ncbi:hypothetical protein CRG98_020922 [Punica granatum]|uniref:Uncharacterized protein n=1 Tax=Punica granatum TaxID=22663 RepID=A0A2I0JT66_PUNGR|nr:hypothetical protein CRG98_020922 [Punica granatum]
MTETLKPDEVGYANDTCTRMGYPSLTVDRSVWIILMPRESAIHEKTVMPLNCNDHADPERAEKMIIPPGSGLRKVRTPDPSPLKSGLNLSQVHARIP